MTDQVHLTLSTVISMETRNMSGVFIQIIMTRFLIWLLATVWIDGFSKTVVFDRKWWKQRHKRKKAERKLLVQLGRENRAFLESGESRTCSVHVAKNLRRVKLLNKIYCTINARDVLFSVNLVTYLSISEVSLVKTRGSSATTAKIWNLLKFCQFFLK